MDQLIQLIESTNIESSNSFKDLTQKNLSLIWFSG